MSNEPIMLLGERVWRTYTGGRNIDRLHDKAVAEDNHFPEEWMYSVTRALNSGREDIVEGLCKTVDNPELTLKELVERDPEGMLGKEHVEKWGNTQGVLVKIIDSKERLTIQVHPDRNKAKELFNSRFGKTECWHILETREDADEKPCLYLGFKEGITREAWEECFFEQDFDRMLSLLNRVEVKKGETYLVKGGVPHAIGAGCMLIEIQEPTDYTIRVEKTTPSGFKIDDQMCHQGIGFEKMFDCFTYTGSDLESVLHDYRIEARKLAEDKEESWELVGYQDVDCFRIEEKEVEISCQMCGEGVFYCLYVVSGQGILKVGEKQYELKRNTQLFVPASSKEYSIVNTGSDKIKVLKLYGPQ